MHDNVENTGVVQPLEQPDAVAPFHFEPTTEVTHDRHKPLLTTTDHLILLSPPPPTEFIMTLHTRYKRLKM